MPSTQVAVGLMKQDAGDTDWHTPLNFGFDEANTRLTLSGTSDPNGTIIGRWKGQRYFDTLRVAFWVFNGTVGTNTGWVRELAQGTVMMWSGAIGSIPSGWVLCDGTLHVPTGYTPPNLKGRFVVGYDSGDADYNAIGDTGGEKTHVLTIAELPAHDHGSAGTHNHDITNADGSGGVFQTINGANTGNTTPGSVPKATQSAGAHTHSSVGSGAAHENRPPFYTLAYIAKL